jgi:hypothetical protein
MWRGNEATVIEIQPFSLQKLAGRALVRVEGAEAETFLHNVLTADLQGLAPGVARYAALLTPQGKILFDMFVVKTDEGFLIDCSAAQRADLMKRLGFYRLRAQVTIAAADEFEVGVASERPQAERAYADSRLAGIGYRVIAPAGRLPEGAGYDTARIRLGLADSDADLGSGEFFPHEANLDQLNGVSFTKGCFVGQEVVSRMEHRGSARSRVLPVKLDGPAPAKGTAILSGDKTVGSLLSSSGKDALALLRLDRLAEAVAPLLTDSVKVKVQKPSWVRYEVPL